MFMFDIQFWNMGLELGFFFFAIPEELAGKDTRKL